MDEAEIRTFGSRVTSDAGSCAQREEDRGGSRGVMERGGRVA